jgi:hypothetical protein
LVIWIHAQHVDATSTFARSFVFPKVYPRPTIANGFIRIEGQNDILRGAVGKTDAIHDPFDRVGIVSPTAREGTVLKLSQSFFLAGLQGATSRAYLADFWQRRLGKIQPQFMIPADQRKTHLGEKLFSHRAILEDIYMNGLYIQLSNTRTGPIDKLYDYASLAMFRMHLPSENSPPDV